MAEPKPAKYRIGFSHPAVKSAWSERMREADPRCVIVTGPASPFVFGEVVAVCPTETSAKLVVRALNLLAAAMQSNDQENE